jgi:DNA polymerase-4
VSNQAFERLGIRTVGQLRRLPLETLRDRFGSSGEHLWRLARGIDDRAVVPEREAKSISHETTFAVDVRNREILEAWLMELTEQVARRMRGHGLRGRTVHLKVRYASFRTVTRSQTLPEPTHLTDELWQSAVDMLRERLPADLPPVRLLDMGVSGFDRSGETQQRLFDEDRRRRSSRLDAATDEITARYGKSAIGRAGRIRDRQE